MKEKEKEKVKNETLTVVKDDSILINCYIIIIDESDDNQPIAVSTSIIQQSSYLLTALTLANIKTLAFSNSRKITEIILKIVLKDIANTNRDLLTKVTAYRAGYSKELRHDIENKLFNNELISVVCTSALELGIDIGQLDSTIIVFIYNIIIIYRLDFQDQFLVFGNKLVEQEEVIRKDHVLFIVHLIVL